MVDPAVAGRHEELSMVCYLGAALGGFVRRSPAGHFGISICPRQVRMVLAAAVLLAAFPNAAHAAEDEPLVGRGRRGMTPGPA
jgi:hypothetical protein